MQRLLTVAIALGLGACAKPPPTCSDGVRNGQEADVDCGGPDCGRCSVGRACETPDDCESGLCRLHACAAPRPACDGGPGCSLAECQPPLTTCPAGCTDLRFDATSCGTCGHACAPNERCEGGSCLFLCPPGTMPCGAGPSATCVNGQVDVLHCGGCNTVCSPGQTCKQGLCQLDCAPFQILCGGQCVSTMTDVLNCGGCGLPCDAGEVCSLGTCRAGCAAPAVICDGGFSCVDVRFDPANCGACGAGCPLVPNAAPLCLNSMCTRTRCNPGFEDCNGLPIDGCEAELAVSPMHCGMCGRACSPCINGSCP